MSEYDGSRGYGSSGDRDKLKENDMITYEQYMDILERLGKLEEYDEYTNLTMPDRNTDEADEFVRKELISAYDGCEERDMVFLEYVIKMYSNPTQWEEFYGSAGLEHYITIGK